MIEAQDRIATGDDLYELEEQTGGKVKLIPSPTTVTQEGTDINKRALQLLQAYRVTATATENIKAGQAIKYSTQIAAGDYDTQNGIAVADGNKSDDTEACLDGWAYLDGTKKGKEIVTREVRAYSPKDDWLCVMGGWRRDYIIGSYTGETSGNDEMEQPRNFNLGFRPLVVLIFSAKQGFVATSNNYTGGIATTDIAFDPWATTEGKTAIQITDTGFRIDGRVSIDRNGTNYIYIAFK